jgi:antitoxin (DNA-binding transcriptional repressor) of toxin-antitoxin stability system
MEVAVGVLSIRELNANVSRAIARARSGEVIDITSNGVVVAEITPKRNARMDDPEFRAAYERAVAGLREGVPGLRGGATYEERTGR